MEDADALYVVKQQPGELRKPTQKEVSGIIGGETNSGGKTKHDIWGLRWRMS